MSSRILLLILALMGWHSWTWTRGKVLKSTALLKGCSAIERAGQLQQALGRCERALAAQMSKSHERALKRDVPTRQFFDLLTCRKQAAVDEALTA